MSQPISVALFIRRLGGRGGGAERVYCELANMLDEDGYDVTCLHCEWGREEPIFPLRPSVRRVNLWKRTRFNPGLPALLRIWSLGYENGFLWAPVAWLSKHAPVVWLLVRYFRVNQPDVVIALMPNAITPSLIAGRITQTKIIASNHNDPQQDYRSTEKWDQNPIDRAIRLRVLGWAAKIHVLLEDYARFFPPEYAEKIEVIHNYPSVDGSQIALDARREKLVIGVGRLTSVKNFEVVVRAWAHLVGEFPDWKLEIYGKGEEEGHLRREIACFHLEEKVKLMGQTDDLVSLYRRAAILAHPARYEGFPLSVTEALACGVPTVGFRGTSGVAQLIRSGENGLLAERDHGAEGFAESLRQLIASPKELQAMSLRARQSVERFSFERYRESWREVIRDLTPSRFPPKNESQGHEVSGQEATPPRQVGLEEPRSS